MDIQLQAIKILKEAYGEHAQYRKGQLETILSIIDNRKTLVVQKTGWGKSIVYFVLTKLLRQQGAGPTIIISPLLALMKNQIDAAKKFKLHAITINIDNKNEWNELLENLDQYDIIIIISPERLSNEKFMQHVSNIRNIKLFVVDEAHTISDWGHDFRPDYQRIVNIIDNFPKDIKVLGTTATANDRVIQDIQQQLGQDLIVMRGDLMRENLVIHVNPTQTVVQRLAWLVDQLTTNEKLMSGQGIIYCLTRKDCDRVAEVLNKYLINAQPYYADSQTNTMQQRLEQFYKGDIQILVATTKLGMGYDKSDIRFIIHYQLPQNLIAYYQQIGRAGRDGKTSYAILMHGNEDEEILNYFIHTAHSKPQLLQSIIAHTTYGKSQNELLTELNIGRNKLQEIMKYLMINNYIYKEGSKYYTNNDQIFDNEIEKNKQLNLAEIRKNELEKLKIYLTIQSCYMKFVADELDAPDDIKYCGICSKCQQREIFNREIEESLINEINLLKINMEKSCLENNGQRERT